MENITNILETAQKEQAQKLFEYLDKLNVNFSVVLCLKAHVGDYNQITIEDFLKSYKVRDLLTWRRFGMQHLYKLAEALEQEGHYLRF